MAGLPHCWQGFHIALHLGRVYCQPRCRSFIGLAAEGRYGIMNDAGRPCPRRQPLLAGRRLVLSALAAGILASGALLGLAAAPSAAASTAAVEPLAVTTSALPAANGGVSYSEKLAATGGIKPYAWSITAGRVCELMMSTTFGTDFPFSASYRYWMPSTDSEAGYRPRVA